MMVYIQKNPANLLLTSGVEMVSKQVKYKIKMLLSFTSLRDMIIWIEDNKEWWADIDIGKFLAIYLQHLDPAMFWILYSEYLSYLKILL